MADYPVSNIDQIDPSEVSKEIVVNELFNAASPSMAFGKHDSASGALTWGYYGGVIDLSGTPTRIANGTLSLTDNATNYVYIDTTGTLHVTSSAPSGWPGPIVIGSPSETVTALYSIITLAGVVTGVTDYREAKGSGVAGPAGPPGATGATGAPGSAAVIVIQVASASSITISLAAYSAYPFLVAELTLGTNATLDIADGFDGQVVRLWVRQPASGGPYTLAQGTHLRPSTDVPWPTISTSAGTMDRMSFEWVGGSPGTADLTSVIKGY